jgi:hypothetical protein
MNYDSITLERWSKLLFEEQMGNMGPDIDRVIRWKKEGNLESSTGAFQGVLQLLDLTMQDPKNSTRLDELILIREQLIDHFMGNNSHKTTDEYWSKLFLDFGCTGAIARGR